MRPGGLLEIIVNEFYSGATTGVSDVGSGDHLVVAANTFITNKRALMIYRVLVAGDSWRGTGHDVLHLIFRASAEGAAEAARFHLGNHWLASETSITRDAR
jgi:hypothetical protein